MLRRFLSIDRSLLFFFAEGGEEGIFQRYFFAAVISLVEEKAEKEEGLRGLLRGNFSAAPKVLYLCFEGEGEVLYLRKVRELRVFRRDN
jgi:hypothetical protein